MPNPNSKPIPETITPATTSKPTITITITPTQIPTIILTTAAKYHELASEQSGSKQRHFNFLLGP